MSENDPSDYECAVVPEGTASSSTRKAGRVNLVIGDFEASEPFEAADSIYVTEDLSDYLWGERRA